MTCLIKLPRDNDTGVVLRIYNERPGGLYNCVNTVFTTASEFFPTTLVVRLDGVNLDPSQYVISQDNQGFTLIVDAENSKALNAPPENQESLKVDYDVVGTAGPNNCILFM